MDRLGEVDISQTSQMGYNMSINRLKVTSVESNNNNSPPPLSRSARRQEVEATMERLWLNNPEQFNPERDAVQRKRVSSTLMTIKKHLHLKDKQSVDLGCGSGTMTRLIRDEGVKIDAVDIASQALELLKANNMRDITPIQDCLPSTRLDDNAYDLVICTEMIGYLQPKEYRMMFAELARLVKKDGIVLCSTSLELNSENALERFAALAETEFEIEEWVLRYDLLWIKFCHFFEMPTLFIKMSQNDFERNKEVEKRKGFGKFWFKINTSTPLLLLWRLINPISKSIAKVLRQSEWLVNFLEKITKFIWDESGISYAMLIGKRRPMIFPLPANELPVEMKHKREVWD